MFTTCAHIPNPSFMMSTESPFSTSKQIMTGTILSVFIWIWKESYLGKGELEILFAYMLSG